MKFQRTVFLEGQRFGKLIAIEYIKSKKYLCKCDCGNEKIFYSGNLLRGHSKSCGCISSVNRESYREEMEIKLKKSIKINENGCWIWQRSKHRQGYGHFGYKGTVFLAHRVSWMIFKGEITEEILVCHSCDNPSCVNPDHLFLGDYLINTRDCIKKGRAKKSVGESHYFSKLKEKDILEIRDLYSKKVKVNEICEKFNISRSHVFVIAGRRAWKHVK